MKVYEKYIIINFLKSFLYITCVFFSFVFVINLLAELDFFKNYNVSTGLILYLNLLNSPSLIFEMFPFIFLISTQFFFIKLLKSDEIQIFKYSGIKNTKILVILIFTSFMVSILIVTLFQTISSNNKNLYLEIKSTYSNDGKYLAVITKNGLWIKDKIENRNYIINANKIKDNYLIDTIISELNDDNKLIKTIISKKINISNKQWEIINPKIIKNNFQFNEDIIHLKFNFDYEKIQTLFSNLSSLSFLELLSLKKNYQSLNISTTEIDVEIQKLISYPIYLILMTILSTIVMINTKKIKSITFKIGIGFFISIIIFYFNNFFNVLGKTEKIDFMYSIWTPIILLLVFNILSLNKINDK